MPYKSYRGIDLYRIDPDTDCWIWQREIAPNGYGKDYRQPGSTLAHRQMYLRLVGPIPEGMTLDHLCRNRACVNPAHLEPVSAGENTRRGAHTRLTPELVLQLRDERRAGATFRSIATKYGMSYSGVRNAIVGVNWQNVGRPVG